MFSETRNSPSAGNLDLTNTYIREDTAVEIAAMINELPISRLVLPGADLSDTAGATIVNSLGHGSDHIKHLVLRNNPRLLDATAVALTECLQRPQCKLRSVDLGGLWFDPDELMVSRRHADQYVYVCHSCTAGALEWNTDGVWPLLVYAQAIRRLAKQKNVDLVGVTRE